MKEQLLILVNEKDEPCGKEEKLRVHEKGLLHRAFSIFIFNTKGELLLQQRAKSKYHSGGLWTNTCCSHPAYGEDLEAAINRRLVEEMGMEANTTFAFSFVYKAPMENGLIEYEFDHVYLGVSDEEPSINPDEVEAWKYVNVLDLQNDIKANPEKYTAWFKICFNDVINNKQFRNEFITASNA